MDTENANGDTDTMIESKKRTSAIGTLGLAAMVMAAGISSAQATAPGSLYAGMQYAAMTIDDEEEFDLGAFVGRFGYVLTEYVSIEGRLGLGVGDDTRTVAVGGVPLRATYSLKDLTGVYGRFTLPIDPVTLYAVAGVTSARVELTIESIPPFVPFRTTQSNRETSGSLGLGVEYRVAEQVTVGVEYMRYYSDLDAFSVGLTFNF
jgi:outer membrane immunogenic protein